MHGFLYTEEGGRALIDVRIFRRVEGKKRGKLKGSGEKVVRGWL